MAGTGALPGSSEPNWRDSFDAAWAAAVAEQDEQRMQNPLEAHWPPPERWPYYAARKIATRRLCERMSATRNGRKGSSGPDRPRLEQSRQAFGGELRGRADVARTSPEPEIEDYKTGSLADPETGGVKTQYRVQMLLYAVLEHEATGVWPLKATLIPLTGEPRVIEIAPSEATAAAESALQALHSYNEQVAAHTAPVALASPSAAHCRFCPFAIQCPAFWSAADESWAEEGIVAVAGRLAGREESRLSTFNIRIKMEAGSVPPGEYLLYQLDAERFGLALGLPDGAEVAAVALVGDVGAHQLRATARTQLTFAVAQ